MSNTIIADVLRKVGVKTEYTGAFLRNRMLGIVSDKGGLAYRYNDVYKFLENYDDAELRELIGGKADDNHNHVMGDIDGLLDALNSKQDALDGTGIVSMTGKTVSYLSRGQGDAASVPAGNHTHNYLPLAGGTLTGALTLNNDPTSPMHAATKGYVDALIHGLDVLHSCRVATTANITLSGTQTIDGVAVVAGDRVLVKNQTQAYNNGVYIVASGAWARSLDATVPGTLTAGAFTFIEAGTANDNTGWVLSSATPTSTTSNQEWTQFSSAGQVSVTGTSPISVSQSGNVFTVAHAAQTAQTDTLSGANVYSAVTTNATGHVTGLTSRALTPANIGALALSGGTMAGTLTLSGNPSGSMDAATKAYVDSAVSGSSVSVAWANITNKPSTFPPSPHDHDDLYVNVTGDTMTGDLVFSGDEPMPIEVRSRGFKMEAGNGKTAMMYLRQLYENSSARCLQIMSTDSDGFGFVQKDNPSFDARIDFSPGKTADIQTGSGGSTSVYATRVRSRRVPTPTGAAIPDYIHLASPILSEPYIERITDAYIDDNDSTTRLLGISSHARPGYAARDIRSYTIGSLANVIGPLIKPNILSSINSIGQEAKINIFGNSSDWSANMGTMTIRNNYNLSTWGLNAGLVTLIYEGSWAPILMMGMVIPDASYNPVTGSIRYNNINGQLSIWNGTSWHVYNKSN